MQSKELAAKILDLAADRKALDPVVLYLGELTIVTDYFIILTGTSRPHVLGIAEHIRKELSDAGTAAWQRETDQDAQWLLLDYGDVVVHIFQEETREFYSLERLWNDAERISLDAFLQ